MRGLGVIIALQGLELRSSWLQEILLRATNIIVITIVMMMTTTLTMMTGGGLSLNSRFASSAPSVQDFSRLPLIPMGPDLTGPLGISQLCPGKNACHQMSPDLGAFQCQAVAPSIAQTRHL